MKLDTAYVHRVIGTNPNLKSIYRWYLSNCISLDAPYHNLRHTLAMMLHVIRVWEGSRVPGSGYGFTLNDEDLYILLISAMFHDFNHSAGKFDDSVNVNSAVSGLRSCMEACLVNDDAMRACMERCEENIRATQYPYVIPDDELNVHQRILRECDILVVLYDNCITGQIMALASEMRRTDIEYFTVGYLDFIFKSVEKFRLVYSIETWNMYSSEFLTEIDEFAKLFKS